MTIHAGALAVVPDDGLPEYPISADIRLDSHYFVQWNLKRWRGSDFRRKGYADPEVGWYGMEMFFLAQDGAPIGTLPSDDESLAFLLRLPLDKWLALCKRETSPLHNWHKVLCDNGEIRLAHPIVLEVAQEAVKSSRSNAADIEKRKQAKRRKDLRAMVERIGATQLLKSPGFIDRFGDWLDAKHAGVQRREDFVRTALDEFCAGDQP